MAYLVLGKLGVPPSAHAAAGGGGRAGAVHRAAPGEALNVHHHRPSGAPRATSGHPAPAQGVSVSVPPIPPSGHAVHQPQNLQKQPTLSESAILVLQACFSFQQGRSLTNTNNIN
eukprot:1193205-Prorocentrum_minimum.AAC.3